LYAAGALTFSDGLRLVRERGRLMKQAGEQEPGSMAALIGLDDETVNAICHSIGDVQVANYNSPGQVVISGKREAVAAAMQSAKEHKAKLVTPLDVSIASHSALMKPMVDAFARVVHDTPLRPPQIPVVGNLNAQPLENIETVRDELIRQPVSSVRWTQSVEYMAARGVDTFVEIGPGRVLSGLIKRIVKGARLFNVSDAASLQPALSQERA
jgi:[acyl-carrier-protein] S-malonyltransferase